MAVVVTCLLLLAVAGIIFAIKIPVMALLWEALQDLSRGLKRDFEKPPQK